MPSERQEAPDEVKARFNAQFQVDTGPKKRLDRPGLRDILERYGAFIDGNDMADDYLDIDEALEAILALIPDIEEAEWAEYVMDYQRAHIQDLQNKLMTFGINYKSMVEEAKKQERIDIANKILEGLRLLPHLSESNAELNNINGYISGVVKALKEEK